MAMPLSRQPGRIARVAFCALVLAASPVMAGKVYKIIDENGKITFTDKPPKPAEAESVQAEQLDIQEGSGNRTAVTRLGNSEFCGHLKMPVDNGYSGRYLEQILSLRKQWESQLKSLEARATGSSSSPSGYSSYRRYGQPAFNQNYSPENLEKMRDYRCGIHWASQTEAAMRQQKEDLVHKVDQHNQHLNELIRRKAATCGTEPEFGVPNFTERKKEWSRCSIEFDALINEGRRALNEADQQLTAIQKTEQ